MADLADIRSHIKVVLSAIDGLTVYDKPPEAMIYPCVVVRPAEATFDDGDARIGLDQWEYDLIVLVALTDIAVAQTNLDPYLAKTGTQSIRKLVRENQQLGFVDGTYAYIAGMSNYGTTLADPNTQPNDFGAVLRLVVRTNG